MEKSTPIDSTDASGLDEVISPLERTDFYGLDDIVKFVEREVSSNGLNPVTIIAIGQALYFKTKRISEKPLSWPYRRQLIVSLIDWIASKYLDDSAYNLLKNSIEFIVPDMLDSMREFGKSKKSPFACLCGKSRPTNKDLEKRAETLLLERHETQK